MTTITITCQSCQQRYTIRPEQAEYHADTLPCKRCGAAMDVRAEREAAVPIGISRYNEDQYMRDYDAPAHSTEGCASGIEYRVAIQIADGSWILCDASLDGGALVHPRRIISESAAMSGRALDDIAWTEADEQAAINRVGRVLRHRGK